MNEKIKKHFQDNFETYIATTALATAAVVITTVVMNGNAYRQQLVENGKRSEEYLQSLLKIDWNTINN